MPTSYALGPRFDLFVKKQVRSGRYNNASEVIRAGLRLLEDREQQRQAAIDQVRAAVQAGVDSGASRSADRVLGRLEDKYRRMRDRRGA